MLVFGQLFYGMVEFKKLKQRKQANLNRSYIDFILNCFDSFVQILLDLT